MCTYEPTNKECHLGHSNPSEDDKVRPICARWFNSDNYIWLASGLGLREQALQKQFNARRVKLHILLGWEMQINY